MAINSTIHTFNGGMNMDLDNSLIPHNVYKYAENFRLVPDKDGKSGVLKNIPGFKSTTVSTLFSHSDEQIVGYCLVRDWLVLFVNYNYTGSVPANSAIYKLQVDNESDYVSGTFSVVIDDNDTEDSSLLNFGNLIKAIGRYESENIIPVYWTDTDNNVRRINIAVYNTTDGLVHSVGNDYISVDKLDFVLSANLFCPIFEEFTNGTLTAGVVFYSYQFYNLHGAETAFSPLSGRIHITNAPESLTTYKYYGSEVDDTTNKGVKLSIDYTGTISQEFDKVRLIRVHYTQVNQVPTITIVKEISLIDTTSSTIYITDSGDSLAEITLEEFSLLSTYLFKALEVTTKNDYLLFGNIEEDVFDVDYDARAYRFDGTWHISYVFEENGNVNRIAADGSWVQYSDYPTNSVVVSSGSDWSIPENADCINRFNDIENDYYETPAATPEFSSYPFAWDSVASDFGGTGKNVSYAILSTGVIIDSVPGDFYNTSTTTPEDPKAGYYYVSDAIGTTNSYASGYADAYLVGYQSDEIYRFGVVFYDEKNRSSYVKWIGDIRFPDGHTTAGAAFDKVSTNYTTQTVAYSYGVRFNVDNIPAGVTSFQIVRAIRKQKDKTILAQGVISQVIDETKDNKYLPTHRLVSQYDKKVGSFGYVDGVYNFVSPEINYGNYTYNENDFLVPQFRLSGLTFDIVIMSAGNLKMLSKYQQLSGVSKSKVEFNDFVIANVEGPPLVSVDNATSYNLDTASRVYVHYVDDKTGVSVINAIEGPAGTCAVFSTDTLSILAECDWGDATKTFDLFVANIKRRNTSQYGGNTYYERLNTEYITCSHLYDTVTYEGVNIGVYQGDTYIGFFDHLRCIWHIDSAEDIANGMSVAYLPLESTMNLTLSSGSTYSRLQNSPYSYAIRENSGDHEALSNRSFNQKKDYYIYNSVYSTQPNIKLFYPENLETDINVFDTRVIVSNKKINNELVDSWTKFSVNDFLDVDSNYGQITSLLNFKNRIFYFQDTGFGTLSINERSLIVDDNVSQLVLGTGGVLDRYDYISTVTGTSSRQGVTTGQLGLYWVDEKVKDLYQYNGEENRLTYLKGIRSLIKNYGLLLNESLVVSDNEYGEILFFVKESGDSAYQYPISYNEFMSSFNGILTYSPSIVLKMNKGLWSVSYADDEDLKKHNASICYNNYYNDYSKNSLLRLVVNKDYPIIKTWDTIEYFSESYDKNATNSPNIYDNTFKYVRFYNDYQNTDYWKLVLERSYDRTTSELELTRRERNWKFNIPRNSVTKDATISNDIFSASNLDANIDFRERMRSSYLVSEFLWVVSESLWESIDEGNSSANEFSVPFIKVNYRKSNR